MRDSRDTALCRRSIYVFEFRFKFSITGYIRRSFELLSKPISKSFPPLSAYDPCACINLGVYQQDKHSSTRVVDCYSSMRCISPLETPNTPLFFLSFFTFWFSTSFRGCGGHCGMTPRTKIHSFLIICLLIPTLSRSVHIFFVAHADRPPPKHQQIPLSSIEMYANDTLDILKATHEDQKKLLH